jgi:alkanesulfonate monooxygenase SsuD/methylene tetrahydromethanopterin reductase-like flavin-dependent oxidoreductase (luciferase family)
VEIGIGLPSTIPGVTGRAILDWAREADEAGFSTVGTIDRVVYGSYETVPTLAAAAAVTERIRLTSAILIAPFRGNGALLAKQLATVDSLSGGRLVVGIAVGGRVDDYEATGTDFTRRGALFDRQLVELREIWSGAPRGFAGAIGPPPVQPGGPPLLFGGASDAAVRRTVEYGIGWISGGGGPKDFEAGADRIRAAWKEAGRAGQPRLAALTYFALGSDAEAAAQSYLQDYYAFLGEFASQIADNALTSEDRIRATIEAFGQVGCDELILFPCSADLDHLRRLAALALP